jgi:hypothetical protein
MNKQIEEMAKIIVNGCREGNCEECKYSEGVLYPECVPSFTAEALYNAGYRRQDEVAREIFTEIEKQTKFFQDYMFLKNGCKAILRVLAELKKKYEVTEE